MDNNFLHVFIVLVSFWFYYIIVLRVGSVNILSYLGDGGSFWGDNPTPSLYRISVHPLFLRHRDLTLVLVLPPIHDIAMSLDNISLWPSLSLRWYLIGIRTLSSSLWWAGSLLKGILELVKGTRENHFLVIKIPVSI